MWTESLVFEVQDSISVGCVPPTCRPYLVVTQVPVTRLWWVLTLLLRSHVLGGGRLPSLDIPTPWIYPPLAHNIPPRRGLIPDIPTSRKDMGPQIPAPTLWTDRHLWKHYLPATSFAGVKIKIVSRVCSRLRIYCQEYIVILPGIKGGSRMFKTWSL